MTAARIITAGASLALGHASAALTQQAPSALARALLYFAPMTPGGGAFDLRVLLIGLALGILLSCFSVTLKRYVYSRFCRALTKKEAFSPEKAVTLKELSLPYLPGLRAALSCPTSPLSRMLCALPVEEEAAADAAADEKASAETPVLEKSSALRRGKREVDSLRFCLTEEGRITAAVRFDRHGEWRMLLAAVLLVALFGYALYEYLPTVWGVLRSIFGG